MKLNKLIIENYRGINEPIEVFINDFNCVVGKNDVGKSTLLKAVDIFLNDKNPSIEDCNVKSSSKTITIELQFSANQRHVIIDDAIETTFEEEELINEEMFLSVKKSWDMSLKITKPKVSICRKIYNNDDFVLSDERTLIRFSEKYSISTQKGNGEEFNNKEKRSKLRDYYKDNNFTYRFEFEELSTTGSSRSKKIYDAIRNCIPAFEYFKADSSLSDSDASVQKYFKDKALKLLKEEVNTEDLENSIKLKVEESLNKITNKINDILLADEKVSAQVNFDWTKLISTTFKCAKDDTDISLTQRGDGFRRLTMMSYFEMLAEENKPEDRNVIFGFEEPETFLHPATQKQLYSKLKAMQDNGYQILVTTHSPNIVSETSKNEIIFVSKYDGKYKLEQFEQIDIKTIVEELGIKGDELIFSIYENIKCLFLVEGPDDVKAFTHTVNKYKEEGKVENTFEELGILIIPIGGCSSIKHWSNFNIIQKLNKPYIIVLDSDKKSADDESPNLKQLKDYGYTDECCCVTNKREIESYIHPSYFQTLNPPIEIVYNEWDDVKLICKKHTEAGRLGGGGVCDRHFEKLTYELLRRTFCDDNNDDNDEFLTIYNLAKSKVI